MNLRAATTGWLVCVLSGIVKINAFIGIYWLHCINEDQQFDLTDEYLVWGGIMVFVPASIIVFVIIVAIKIICFHFADFNQRRKRAQRRSYGEFEDEAAEQEDAAANEAVTAVYFRAMDKVNYATYAPEGQSGDEQEPREDDPRNTPYMV